MHDVDVVMIKMNLPLVPVHDDAGAVMVDVRLV